MAGGMFAKAVEMMATICFRRCRGGSSGLDFRFRYDKFTLLRKQAGLWAATYYICSRSEFVALPLFNQGC